MTGSLERTLAAVFTQKGEDTLTVNAFKHALSLDLRWFTPAEARRVLMHAADVGLVAVDEDAVRPLFDPRAVKVPVDFRPTIGVLDERPKPPAEPAPAAAPPKVGTAEAPLEPEAETPQPAPEAPAAPKGVVARALEEAARVAQEDPADVRRAFEDEKARARGVLGDDVIALVVARRRGADVRALAAEAAAERAGAHG